MPSTPGPDRVIGTFADSTEHLPYLPCLLCPRSEI